ncbi:hypothetical protein EMIT07CA2_180014 [Brevibacillus sp. IT-7CA2]
MLSKTVTIDKKRQYFILKEAMNDEQISPFPHPGTYLNFNSSSRKLRQYDCYPIGK